MQGGGCLDISTDSVVNVCACVRAHVCCFVSFSDCRRLREGAIVMEILKENPSTNFYVKKRPFAASFTS